jgi:hypothetical protein
VHIITAYNPAGVEIDARTNGPLHQALGNALGAHDALGWALSENV